MWVQTWHPQHPLYAALLRHDYERFAHALLEERKAGGLPPFTYLALVRADAKQAEVAAGFLNEASARAADMPEAEPVTI